MQRSPDTNLTTRLRSGRGVAVRALLAASTLAWLAGAAQAQYKLGDGHRLDRNQQKGTDGKNYRVRPTIEDELRFRNAIVTGNAPDGMSFRGDIDYTAPFEFRGELGADDAFGFRRDSLRSGLAGMGVRGTDALQYQFSLTTGGRVGSQTYGPFVVTRGETPAYAAPLATAPTPGAGGEFEASAAPGSLPRPTDPRDPSSRVFQDPRGAGQWKLRSTSAYAANRSLESTIVGFRRDGESVFGVSAAPLTGVSFVRYDSMVQQMQAEQERAQAARAARQAAAGGVSTAVAPTGQAPADTAAASTQVSAPAPDPTALPPGLYGEVIAGFRRYAQAAQPPAPEPADAGDTPTTDASADQAWAGPIDELYRALRGAPTRADEEAARAAAAASGANALPPEVPAPDAQPGAEPGTQPVAGATDPASPDAQAPRPLDPDTIRMLREAAGVITSLTPSSITPGDLFAGHMREGERLLTQGRYFDAEERFTAALTIRPGDLGAAIGRVHAQTGAGLLVSGATNLRLLLLAQPEVAGVRYDRALLPAPDRIAQVIAGLRDRIARGDAGDEEGLLLAYLGYQTSDTLGVRDGLAAMRRAADATDGGAPGPRRTPARQVLDLVEAVWVVPEGAPGGNG